MVYFSILETFLDAIIKRKLLIEGESGIDDKRFTLLLKDYLHWATSENSADLSDGAYQLMLEKIFQCENSMDQAYLIQMMNLEQSNRYIGLLEEIDRSIEKAQVDIMEERKRLKEARVIRKNRQEYHNLAKVVKEYPERQETLKKLQKMKVELNNLQNIDRMVDEKINLRKKQFHLFLVTLRDLQKTIEQDTPIPTEFVEQKNTNPGSPMDTS
nr:tho complex subunit 7 [Hymenolepis microstoma]